MNYSQRLNELIPGGAHTYSRGDDQFPANAPPILAKGKGCYIWDANGKKYLDYGMALRAVTVGYANREISYHEYEEYKNIFTQKQDLIYNTIDQLLKKLKKGI